MLLLLQLLSPTAGSMNAPSVVASVSCCWKLNNPAYLIVIVKNFLEESIAKKYVRALLYFF
jgi:hypothetical protein